jgi:hypothetical protein
MVLQIAITLFFPLTIHMNLQGAKRVALVCVKFHKVGQDNDKEVYASEFVLLFFLSFIFYCIFGLRPLEK